MNRLGHFGQLPDLQKLPSFQTLIQLSITLTSDKLLPEVAK
jgi:hypothetical protein